MQTALITGATGFIGQSLVPYLLQKNIKVRVLLRNSEKAALFPSTVEVFIADLTDPASLQGACDGIDTIFHLGGYAHAWGEQAATFATAHHAINFRGTQNILQEAKCAQVKTFILFSSVKAVADSETCLDETWEQAPTTPYGLAKRAAEQLILAEQSDELHVCILRLSLVYGPGWKGNLDQMLRSIDRGHFPPLPKVNNHRSMVSIHDVCTAAFLAATRQNAQGKVYFVTDGVYYSTCQLYALMREALGKSAAKWHVPLSIFHVLAKVGDFCQRILGQRFPFNSEALWKLFGSAQYNSQRIQTELGFQPKDNLKTLLPAIVATYRAQHGNS